MAKVSLERAFMALFLEAFSDAALPFYLLTVLMAVAVALATALWLSIS